MDFAPTEEQSQIQRTAREVADRVLAPKAAARDLSGEFPVAELRELARLGLLGIAVPEALGGVGADPVAYSLAMQELARGNFSGGGTAIDACSRKALARIEEIYKEGTTHRPELVVISDGDDMVRLTPEDLGPTRLHGFVVEAENVALTDLAVKSGGVGIDRL